MSANLFSHDKNWLLNIRDKNDGLTEVQESLVCSLFDEQTDFDVQKIKEEIKKIKFLKKVCIIKLLMFIPEYILTFILLDKKYLHYRKETTKLYHKFLTNKISVESLTKELIELEKSGSI